MKTIGTATLALLMAATPSLAQNLIGAWEGALTCKNDRGQGKDVAAGELQISEPDADEVHVEFDGTPYAGRIFPGTKGPSSGVGYFVACTSGPTGHTEVERMRWKVDEDGSGALKLIGAYANPYAQGTCKSSFKRIRTTDPGVAPCP
jgi:hypothetical protein